MSTTNDGGPAFVVPDMCYPNGQVQIGTSGMSLRAWFAGHAMAALCVGYDNHSHTTKTCALLAVAAADDLIAALNNEAPK